MSHEILLIAGRDDADDRRQRRLALNHAAASVPGFTSFSVIESPTATAALVDTSPPGGTFAELMPRGVGGRITLATTRRGLSVSEGGSAGCGAEAGHVTVSLNADRSASILTDGVGVLPSYWGVHGGVLFFATHLASLVSLGLPSGVDELGLIEYLAMLHPMANRTLLRDAALLSAGASLHWQAGRIDLRHEPLFVPSSDSLTDDEAVEAFAATWPIVVGDAFEGAQRPSVGLSGGLDSRAIAETAVARGHRPITYTYGTADTFEGQVGARVAQVLGLPHVSIPVTEDRMLAHARTALDALDGAHSASEMYELWFSDLLRSFTDVVINGLDGGTLWGDDKSVGLTDPEAVLQRQWRRYASEVTASAPFLSDALREGAEDAVRRSLAASLEGWDLESRSDMVLFWRIANRQQRWGSMLTNGLRRAGLRAEIPFLDSRFLALAARVSPTQRRNGNLYLRVHREVFPLTSGIPRSDDGNAPRSLNHVYWSGDTSIARQMGSLLSRHPISAVKRGVRLGGRLVLGHAQSITPLTGAADWVESRRSVFPAEVWVRTRRAYAGRLADLLEEGHGCSEISGDAVARSVEGLRAGRPVASVLTLGKVAAAQMWLGDYQRRAAARLLATGARC